MFIDFLNQFFTSFGRGGPKRVVQNLSNHHHQLKTISPNHQDFKVQITKSPHFFKINHHHHHFLESPNHHIFLAPITKSPLFFGPNHQSPKDPWSPDPPCRGIGNISIVRVQKLSRFTTGSIFNS